MDERLRRRPGKPARRRGGDRAEDSEPDRRPHLLARHKQAGREALLAVADPGGRGDRGGREREPHPDGHQDQARERIGSVASVHRQPAEKRHAARCEQQPADEERLDPDAPHVAGRDLRADSDADRHRQPGQAGLDRRQAQDVLHVERQEEHHPEHGGAQRQHPEVGTCKS